MSESMKPRFSIDLDEIERQIAQAQSAPPAQPGSATRSDPLAELARIVGQDDPFQSLLANEGGARGRQQAPGMDDLFAMREGAAPAARARQTQGRRGELDGSSFDPGQQAGVGGGGQSYAYQDAAPAHGHDGYRGDAYAQDYYDEAAASHAAADYPQPEYLDYPPVQKSRSRKGMIAIGAVVGAAVLGIGGAYFFSGGSTATDGAPPLIQAMKGPVKVEPQNPGGVEIPNQNKQIYERANQGGDTKVVNREEQPVDVQQAVRMSGNTMADATGATVPASSGAPQPTNGLNLGEPRKVRTITIRPDGTVAQPQVVDFPRPTAGAAEVARPAPAPVQTAAAPAPAQPKPAASTPAAVAPAPAPAAVPAAATPPVNIAPQKVASAQPVAIAPAADEPEEAPVEGFSVQLGLAKSESGAEAELTRFQRKYSELEGLPPLIRKAEVNGNTIYRVRVGPMSREEASSLCSRLQGQGGQCFVAKN